MSSLSVKRCQTVQSVHTLVLDAISLLLDFFSTVISTVTTSFKWLYHDFVLLERLTLNGILLL